MVMTKNPTIYIIVLRTPEGEMLTKQFGDISRATLGYGTLDGARQALVEEARLSNGIVLPDRMSANLPNGNVLSVVNMSDITKPATIH